MKEIDTESQVVWPAWCYSANISTDILRQKPAKATTAIVGGKIAIQSVTSKCALRSAAATTASFTSATQSERATATTKLTNQKYVGAAVTDLSKQPNSSEASTNTHAASAVLAGKMLSERSLLLGSGFNSIENAKKVGNYSHPSNSLAATITTNTLTPTIKNKPATITKSTTAAVAAAAYAAIYLEKVKNEKFSPLGVTSAQIDSLKDAIMETTSAAKNKNSNNSTTISNNHKNSNCNLSENNISSHHQEQQQPQHLSIDNNVKQERLSPGTNGEQKTTGSTISKTYSRSRSATPLSFRGMSPQQQQQQSPPSTSMPLHNLSSNLINNIQQAASVSQRNNAVATLSLNIVAAGSSFASNASHTAGSQDSGGQVTATDFSARNYSDIMRSLAAKYNNTNPNDSNTARRHAVFDNPSASAIALSSSVNCNKSPANVATKKPGTTNLLPSVLSNKDGTNVAGVQQLPPTHSATHSRSASPASTASVAAALNSQSSQTNPLATAAAAAAAAAVAASSTSVSPFMTTLLSSLPFSQGILPPLMDMSSTQALLTLARAAKEVEIQNILRTAQQQPKRPNSRMSSSAAGASATTTAGSPRSNLNAALQQAAQFVSPALIYAAQFQQQQQQSQSQNSRQSSPRSISNNSNIGNNTSKSENTNSDKCIASATAPLDLSAQPPASKRFKAESTTSSQCSVDGSRACQPSSTSIPSGSTSTSPAPLTIETTFNFNANANANANADADACSRMDFSKTKVGSSSPTLGTTKAIIRQCQAHSDEVNSWSVDDVCAFVGGIDICAEYVQHFRDQCIDGTGLPLLTEDHLVNSLGMKLGPALKLHSILAKKLGGPCPCVSCVALAQQLFALQTAAATKTSAVTTTLPSLVTTTSTTTTATTAATAVATASAGKNLMPITTTNNQPTTLIISTTKATTQIAPATTTTAQTSGDEVACNGPDDRVKISIGKFDPKNKGSSSSSSSSSNNSSSSATGSKSNSNCSSPNICNNSISNNNKKEKQNISKDGTTNTSFNKNSSIYLTGDDLSCS